jgi:hypothetical protein
MNLATRFDWNLLLAPFASTILFGSLANAVAAYREICEKNQAPMRKVKCSYFVHIGGNQTQMTQARERMVNYISMAGLRKKMSQGGTGPLPPTMEYFKKIGEKLNDPSGNQFDDNSILFGSTQQIIDTLKRVEGIGIDEVILYFNFGNMPNTFVQDQMHQFMSEIAPAFAN